MIFLNMVAVTIVLRVLHSLIPFCVESSGLFENFSESTIFYAIMSIQIPNIAVKYPISFFLKALIRPLKWNFPSFSNFHAEYKNIKHFSRLRYVINL